MLFWLITVVMLAIAVLCILLPLAGFFSWKTGSEDAEGVYRAQLRAIDAKLAKTPANSLLLQEERAEVARRLLREVDKSDNQPSGAVGTTTGRRIASIVALLGVPLVSFGLYGSIGSPGVPDAPIAARQNLPLEQRSVQEVVQLAEDHLAKNPDDPKGWTLLAGVYQRLNQPAKRANALRQIIRINGDSPKLAIELAEALTRADGNVVPSRAKKLFQAALAADENLHKARFYLAIALGQEGRHAQAAAEWQRLSETRRDDPVWQETIGKQLAEAREAAGLQPMKGPTQADIAAASQQSAEDRMTMIRGMVEGLSERLQDEPGDLQGWIRLVRSYTVLQMSEKAVHALQTAQTHFSGDPDAMARLAKLEEALDLNGKTKQ